MIKHIKAGAVFVVAAVVMSVTVVPDMEETPILEPSVTPYVDNFVDDVDNSEDTEVVVVEEEVVVVQEDVAVEEIEEPSYSDEQREILAIIIYQEAGGDAWSDDTRRKVGSVFLNRVNSSLFPDTFLDVALQKGQYGTLSWTGLKWPDRAVNSGEAHAVERAYTLAEELLVGGSILPDNVIWQAGFQQGDGVYCQQDGFYFCYSEVNK